MANSMDGSDVHSDSDIDENNIDFSEIEERYAPEIYNPLASAIVVDGLPLVSIDRHDKLLSVVQKAFASKGLPFDPKQANMPMAPEDPKDPNSPLKSKGFLFALLPDPAAAVQASRVMDGHPLDKRHTFFVRTTDEIDELNTLAEEWVEPTKETFKQREHLRDWISDPAGRDQVVIHRADQVQVGWINRTGLMDVAHSRDRWSESYVTWSPRGTMLATLHVQGIAVWGGPSFQRLLRLPHLDAQYIEFSPNETYVVSWSPRPIELPPPGGPPVPFTPEDEGKSIVVWNVATGKIMRTFHAIAQPGSAERGPRKIIWPAFKWSSDDKYLARVTPGEMISIYETPSMVMLDKKSVKIEGVVDFEWRPLPQNQLDSATKIENMLAYWTPDIGNRPACVRIMSVPSKETVRSKNLFNMIDCRLNWQSNGDYLCVKVDRLAKANAKTKIATLEIFRLKEKGTPVQTIELKDMVIAFSWEPKGDRFALSTTNDPSFGQIGQTLGNITAKTGYEFFQLDVRKGDFRRLKTIEGKTGNTIFWSPKGRHLVFVTLGSTVKCDCEFFDVDLDPPTGSQENDIGERIQSIAAVEHFGMTRLEWDPSGRYVATIGSIWDSSVEPGYRIWDFFKGREIARQSLDKLKEFIWRPRPATLLSKEQQKSIRKNLKEYSKKFEEEDAAESANVSQELIAHRRKLLSDWDEWRVSVKNELDELRKATGRALPHVLRHDENELTIEEVVEELIDEKEEIVP